MWFASARQRNALWILHRSLLSVVVLSVVHLLDPGAAFTGSNRWTSAGPTGGLVWHIAPDPANPSVLYNATEGGPFKSTDGGESWKRLAEISKVNGFDMGQRSYWLTVAPDLPTMVFAGTDRSIFRSEDGGAT